MLIIFRNPMRASGTGAAHVTEATEPASVDTTPGIPLSEAAPALKDQLLRLFKPAGESLDSNKASGSE